MPGAAEQSPEHDPAALFRQWLESFTTPDRAAPWDSVRLLGESLQAVAAAGAAAGGVLPDMAAAVRELARDFRARLGLLIGMPDLPASAPSLAAFPMLGPAREWQLALDALWQCWMAERAAAAALQRADWCVLAAGLEAFERSLEGPTPLPDSLLELHGSLVAHCEAAHRQALREDKYVSAFGAHTNASMAFRDALAALVERGMPMVGLPRPSELQALAARLAALESRLEGTPEVMKPAKRASRGRARSAGRTD